MFTDLLGGKLVNIRLTIGDERDGPIIKLLEVVRGVVLVLTPFKAEPSDVSLDRVDVFLLFFGRVGVIKTQVTRPAELLRHAEVEAYCFGVANVEIAVGLGREARHDSAGVFVRLYVLGHDLTNEIKRGLSFSGSHALDVSRNC